MKIIKSEFSLFLLKLGLKKSDNIIVHSSFKRINSAFPRTTPNDVIENLKEIVTSSGSIIFPTFTYCFKRTTGDYEIFDRVSSKSKVGLISETFRSSESVIRTSSPTHSFALWGKITEDIAEQNSPESPLGRGGVLEWLTNDPDSYVLMLGTNFSSLTYGHYLEIETKIPWYNFSPWDHLNVLPIGVSNEGEQILKEVPGCAKSFVNFESYLLKKKLINKYEYEGLSAYFISINLLLSEGMELFSEKYNILLCPPNTCKACDSRRKKFL